MPNGLVGVVGVIAEVLFGAVLLLQCCANSRCCAVLRSTSCSSFSEYRLFGIWYLLVDTRFLASYRDSLCISLRPDPSFPSPCSYDTCTNRTLCCCVVTVRRYPAILTFGVHAGTYETSLLLYQSFLLTFLLITLINWYYLLVFLCINVHDAKETGYARSG